ncbi:hypothetical protein F0562_020103 [Nyssa sinensis]|uniref:DYW domain-containing protein n=1 Tax=Nyssa sinensis TaxID=561372 RepID=A0A5J5BR00_9ASTE|nr:hypothetical protein F0562_020103 [Nyssa sinensis]
MIVLHGEQVHCLICKHGFEFDIFVGSALVDMYAKCFEMRAAGRMFDEMPERNLVSWNSMIVGFLLNKLYDQAVRFFTEVLGETLITPDQIIKTGFGMNTCVSSSMITMYAKCGSLVDAQRVFQESEYPNVVSWTAIISACQQHGCANQVIELFENMLEEGIKPDYITLVSVLSACSHTGRVEEGFAYFNSMTTVHSLNPGPEHYACMVDLLGRAGRLNEAKRFAESIPIKPDASVWGALLGACRNHGDLEMGRDVADKLFEIEPNNPGNYVLLCNMYTRNGRLEEANEVRRLMGVNGVRKEPGCSWIDVKNETFVFTAHDRSHSRTKEIYEMLEKIKQLVKKKVYVAATQFAINNVEEYKEQSLWYHSEKLALAFGLLTVPAGAPIRIKKNLRTCGDCHTVMKFASEIFNREIIVRYINRFHQFVDGLCSCRDYW